jgi:hypothetical protein
MINRGGIVSCIGAVGLSIDSTKMADFPNYALMRSSRAPVSHRKFGQSAEVRHYAL